jgi:hypothetical protein
LWEAADTTAVLNRPGQSTAWLFGDTLVGQVQANGAAQADGSFVNSSAMTESGACIATHLGAGNSSLFTDPGDGTVYWPGGAVARSDGSMDVMLTHIQLTQSGVGFAPLGVAVAHVNADLSVASITPITASKTTGPAPGGGTEVRAYGGSTTTDGSYAYLYTFMGGAVDGFPRADQYVARVPLSGSLTGDWDYWACNVAFDASNPCPPAQQAWKPNAPAQAVPMSINPDALTGASSGAPLAAFHVTRYGTGYIAVAKSFDWKSTNPTDNRVLAWTSDDPSGPWTSIGQIGQATPPSAPGGWTYVAQLLHTPSAGWVLTWNSNADSSAVQANVRLYGPQFATPSNMPPDSAP